MLYIQIIFLVLSLLLTLMFFIYGFNHYFLLTMRGHYRLPSVTPLEDNKRPFVSVQLPIYNERYVVRRLVTACAKMVEQYGSENAEIVILDDSNDDTVKLVDELVDGFKQKGFQIQTQRRFDRVGYKAGALEIALERTKAEFIAIFDADYTPSPDFLLRTIPYLVQDEKVAIVQSRWTHLNRDFNPITKAIAIGIDVHFIVEQTGRFASECFQNFNGSGGVLRKKALMEAGGWQADTLAEDLDASYRMQLKGYKVLYIRDLTSPGEVPPTVPSFIKQQARWANGSLRAARKLLPSILADKRLKPYQQLEAYIHLTGYLLHPMMFISFLLASFGTIFEIDTFLIHTQTLTPIGNLSMGLAPMTALVIHDLSWGALDLTILVSMIAAWVSPLVSLKSQQLSIRENITSLMVLFLLGSGISISNTIEAIKALLTNRVWEFTRTPKYASLSGKTGWQNRKYQTPLDFNFLLEMAAVLLGLTAIIFALLHGQYIILIMLIPYTAAYLFITVYTLKESRSMAPRKHGER
jgi:cellulose synthase/poly-beta-1,6-N-acetylglucosamine synthase-like glycosyltransferase